MAFQFIHWTLKIYNKVRVKNRNAKDSFPEIGDYTIATTCQGVMDCNGGFTVALSAPGRRKSGADVVRVGFIGHVAWD